MKNKDIMEWMLDEGIDPLTTVTTDKGEMYLSDILTKHLTEQLRIHDVIWRSEQCEHDFLPCKHKAVSEFDKCNKCGKII